MLNYFKTNKFLLTTLSKFTIEKPLNVMEMVLSANNENLVFLLLSL